MGAPATPAKQLLLGCGQPQQGGMRKIYPEKRLRAPVFVRPRSSVGVVEMLPEAPIAEEQSC